MQDDKLTRFEEGGIVLKGLADYSAGVARLGKR